MYVPISCTIMQSSLNNGAIIPVGDFFKRQGVMIETCWGFGINL